MGCCCCLWAVYSTLVHASIPTCIGEADAAGVPTCIGEALATGNPLPKPWAGLAAVATLCAVVPGTVPGLVLPWGIGILTLGATRVAPDWDTGLEASCSGGRSGICGIGMCQCPVVDLDVGWVVLWPKILIV